jgi:YebC/PmpR family DNA-binding regulatory protein
MAGHSHWKQIKLQKTTADQKRGQVFSKLLTAISIASRQEPNPEFNPRLRSLMEKAKENKVPNENIEKAISKVLENKNLEELIIEAYGPEKTALIIEAISDNRNRTIAEIKHLLSENEAKIANPGSVLWSFEKINDEWRSKFKQQISKEGGQRIQKLIQILEKHNDVQKVITNSQ